MSHRAAVALTAAVAVGLAVSGCRIQVNIGSRTMTDEARVDTPVSSIDLSSGDGDVRVEPGSGPGVAINRTISYHGKTKPRPGQQVNNGVLTFTKGCSNCSVSYVLTVPASMQVKIRNGSGSVNVADVASAYIDAGSGDVQVSNVPGAVRAHTGSGSVRAVSIGGQADLHSSSGDVMASEVNGGTMRADTGSGSVRLIFSAAPSNVHAETGSGDLFIELPDGRYRIDPETGTGSGDEGIRIDSDPTATATVYARTGSGSLQIVPVGRSRQDQPKRP